MKKYIPFFRQLTILTLVIGIVATALFVTVLKEYYLPIFPFLLIFFAGITASFHSILMNTLQKRPKSFSYMFLGLSGGKLFVMLILIVVYLILRRSTVIPFLAGTFLLYLVFTFFEVKTLLRLVQGKE